MNDDTHQHTTLRDDHIEEVPLQVLEEIENEQAETQTEDAVIASGEETVSGGSPAVGSDDDVLAINKEVGLHVDEDPDNPQELNIAKAVEEAEEDHWNR